MSLPLLRKILATMAEFGWLSPGQTVVDPFGGRGSTAAVWCAMDPANRAATVEIEPHFVAMQQSVKANAEKRMGRELKWTILQGDSRQCDTLLAEVGAAVTSPPYGGNDKSDRTHERRDERRLGENFKGRGRGCFRGSENYGLCRDNIGNLKDPDPPAVVSSPPYGTEFARTHNGRGGGTRGTTPSEPGAFTLYGTSPGQIEGLPDPIAVLSPPFEAQCGGHTQYTTGPLAGGGIHRRHAASQIAKDAGYSAVTAPPYEDAPTGGGIMKTGINTQSGAAGRPQDRTYCPELMGNSEAQIGNQQGETYESACAAVYAALARAGVRHLALVTKNPTRAGKLRRLDKLTARLLRQAGYRVVGWRRAWLFLTQRQVEALHGQSRLALDTAESTRVQGRLSFFRRLHMKRGGVAAAYEDVFFAELDAAADER
jgi:hypothetical protein